MWTGKNKDEIDWDGTLYAKKFVGDGSGLTGVTGSGAAWGSITGTLSNQTDLQNALDAKTTDSNFQIISGQYAITSSAVANLQNNYNITSAQYTVTSAQLSDLRSQYNITSAQYIVTSAAHAVLSTNYNTTSAAYIAHAADSSDPHGAHLTQTNITCSGTISGAKFFMTADSTASGAELIRNVLIGTEATPFAASNCQQGTIYLQYTA